MSLTIENQIAKYVSRVKYDDVTSNAINIAKKSLLDSVSAIIAGTKSSSAKNAVSVLTKNCSNEKAHVFNQIKQVSNEYAAMCNAIYASARDIGDCLDINPYHPTLNLLPVLLAVIDDDNLLNGRKISGKEFITALVIGQDLGIRFSLALDYSPINFGLEKAFKILAPIAALCSILKLDELTIQKTMGMGIGYGTMIQDQSYIEGADSTKVIYGMLSFSAYLYTKLNINNINGPLEYLNGKNGFFSKIDNKYKKEYLIKDLGEYYYNNYISHKPFAASRAIHNQIGMACELHSEVEVDNIEEINVYISPVIYEALYLPRNLEISPPAPEIAELSIPFTVATALLNGKFFLEDLEPSSLSDSNTLELAKKITVIPDESFYSTQAVSESVIEIIYTDARRLINKSNSALGGVEKPISYFNGLDDKFKACLEYSGITFKNLNVDEFIKNIYEIEKFEDVTDIFKQLWELDYVNNR